MLKLCDGQDVIVETRLRLRTVSLLVVPTQLQGLVEKFYAPSIEERSKLVDLRVLSPTMPTRSVHYYSGT